MTNVYEPEEFFTLTLKIFKLFGVWPLAVKNPTIRNFGYGFQIYYVIALLPTQLTNIYLNRNNLQKLMDNCFLSLTCAVYVAKLGILFFRQKKIENLFKRLHYPIFAPRKKEHLMVLKNFTFMAKVYALVFLLLPQITCLCWILNPFVDNKKEKELLFAAWYPFDTKIKSIYEITYAIQTILLLNTATMNSMMDVLILNFYLVMAGQLEILKIELRSLADTNVENKLVSSFPRENNTKLIGFIQKDGFSKKTKGLKENFQNRFANCTEHYDAILSFVNDVTNLFQFGIVAQVCASCIIICVTCFEITLMSPKTLQFYVMLQYQACILIEIFCYTWQGNEITVKIAELKDAAYNCTWTLIPDKDFRKSLCIIMSRMQIAVELRVGGFFLLSVNTFFTILSSAYSFYVLLKQLHKKN